MIRGDKMSLNEAFKALSDPTRRQILTLLKEDELTAGEIASHFNMQKPSVSHHLKILKHASLIEDERRGQHIYYSLNTTVFHELMGWYFNFIDKEESK